MVFVLRAVGWLGIVLFGSNAAIKIFASDEVALRYAGPGRELDLNITVAAFCLIFLALAAILAEVRK